MDFGDTDVALGQSFRSLKSASESATIRVDEGRNAANFLSDIESLIGTDLERIRHQLSDIQNAPVKLKEASLNLVEGGGKLVRPSLTLLVARLFESHDQNIAIPCAIASELVHSATLLHDDVIDEGETRRGRPASRVLWGNLVSVLSGDLLLVRALDHVHRLQRPDITQDLIQTLEALINGEVYQLEARKRLDLTEQGYFEIIRNKTGSLFRFAARAGIYARQTASRDCDAQLEQISIFGENVGLAFQIMDDVIDIQGESAHVGKRLSADILEGKTTLPMVFALQANRRKVAPVLEEAHTNADAASALASLTEVKFGCAKAHDVAQSLTQQALNALHTFPATRARETLEFLVRALCQRHA